MFWVIPNTEYVLPYTWKQRFYIAHFPEKSLWQSVFHFWQKRLFYPQNDSMEINCICPYIHPPLSVIWHVNCLWFFEKCSWQSFWLNKPLFTKMLYFTKIHWSMKCFIGHLKPQVHLNICQETTVLSCMLLEKELHDKMFPFLTKNLIFTPKWWNCAFVLYALKFNSTSVSMIWYIKCGWGIYRCSMMVGWMDRQMHTWWQYPLAKG